MSVKYIECCCASPEHVIRFISDPENNEVYIEVQLCGYKNFIERTWSAIRYIFGYECKYGHWDGALLQEAEIKNLENLIKEHKKAVKNVQSA